MELSIQNNLLAMNANRMLNITNGKKTKSTEKLSSGYRVNRAADDAAGLAISEKMRRQIKGLTQGTRNTQDGISMCQIADGALNEVSDMMHRLTELSVQSANGTNDEQDRQAIQQEVNALLDEIDRVSDTTTFNEIEIFKPDITIIGNVMSREDAMRELSNGGFKTVDSDIKNHAGEVILTKDAANTLFASMRCYFALANLYDDFKRGVDPYDGTNGTQTSEMSEAMRLGAEACRIWHDYDDRIVQRVNGVDEFVDSMKASSNNYKTAVQGNAAAGYAADYSSDAYQVRQNCRLISPYYSNPNYDMYKLRTHDFIDSVEIGMGNVAQRSAGKYYNQINHWAYDNERYQADINTEFMVGLDGFS